MYGMLTRGITYMIQMGTENQLDQAIVRLSWFDAGKEEHVRHLLLMDVCTLRSYVKVEKNPFYYQQTNYTEKVLEMSKIHEPQCLELNLEGP